MMTVVCIRLASFVVSFSVSCFMSLSLGTFLFSVELFAMQSFLSITKSSSCLPFSKELPACTLLSSMGSDAKALSLELHGCPLPSGAPFVFLFLFLLFFFLVFLSGVSFWVFTILSYTIGSAFVALFSSL